MLVFEKPKYVSVGILSQKFIESLNDYDYLIETEEELENKKSNDNQEE